MNVTLENPSQTVDTIVTFLVTTFQTNHKVKVAVAVSGGIDSAVSLTLCTRAFGADKVIPVFLPHQDQSVVDSQAIATFNQIPESQWRQINIEPVVAGFTEAAETQDQYRLGNAMARARMILLYDIAKEADALVCGTENKSEKYLGYFTRFGDEASDIEPIQHLYKTQVRQLAEHLKLPEQFLSKSPSAGLWQDQTDQDELGFSYQAADQVLQLYIDQNLRQEFSTSGKNTPADLVAVTDEISTRLDLSPEITQQVIARVEQMWFKQVVPYHIEEV
jgi:NAD+ synthase